MCKHRHNDTLYEYKVTSLSQVCLLQCEVLLLMLSNVFRLSGCPFVNIRSAALYKLAQNQQFLNLWWSLTPWSARPGPESWSPSLQRSTSRRQLNYFSSSWFLTLRCLRSSSSSGWHGDSSSSGSTPPQRWRRPAAAASAGQPGRLCCTLPGCVCPWQNSKAGRKSPGWRQTFPPWLCGLQRCDAFLSYCLKLRLY